MIWFLWINAAVYHNLHGYDDLRTRFYVFVQIGILVVLSVFIHDALGETSEGFGLTYGVFMAFLTFLWWRTGVHDPAHRPQTIPYITTYPIAVGLFFISAFVPPPFRFYLWVMALLMVLILPMILSGRGQRGEYYSTINITSASLRERFKLFTIIVFGEAIIGVVAGLSAYYSEHHGLDITITIIGALGLTLIFALWWIYFDAASDHPVKPSYSWVWLWMLVQLPIWIGITMVGPSTLHMIEFVGEHGVVVLEQEIRWLLTGAIALTLFSTAGFLRTLDVGEFKDAYRKGSYMAIGLAAVVIALGIFGSFLSIFVLLICLVIILIIPILFSLYLQAQLMEKQESGQAEDNSEE
jgi:low temperature requirement protein LtrA